ncbi:myoD family inhibitor [Esox lucius]|nr:myoD family inhibitor [Esox lucius]
MDKVELIQQMRTEQTVISQDRAQDKEADNLFQDFTVETTQPQPLANAFAQQSLPNQRAGEHAGEPASAEASGSEPDRNGCAGEDEDFSDSQTDHTSTNDVSRLLPDHVPDNPYKLNRGVHESSMDVPVTSSPKMSPITLANGPSPVCTPPPVSSNQKGWSPLQAPPPPACQHGHPNQKQRMHSTTKCQNSLKADATQIKEIAGDDCCVHCVLACLFCQMQSLCSVLAQCLACGEGCEALCCCGEGASGGLLCGEGACSVLLDCGILEDCCESSDCLEICLECCSICFPA